MKSPMNLCRWQLLVCLLGMVAGFLPSLSFTETFWEIGLSQIGDGPVRFDWVTPGSPAMQAGFRVGDAMHHPSGFKGVQKDLEKLQPGEKRSFVIRRDDKDITIDFTGVTPHVAAVWYAHFWHPIAGALFLAMALLVFGTAPLTPAPYWRSAIVGILGFGIAVGFTLALAESSAFTRVRIWQQWLMGGGDIWSFGQAYVGIVAGLLLAGLAALELRLRLSKSPRQNEAA